MAAYFFKITATDREFVATRNVLTMMPKQKGKRKVQVRRRKSGETFEPD